MKCFECQKDFPENQIQLSHDVPCYLFYKVITRSEKKNLADKYPRHHLCIKCHENYEQRLNAFLIAHAVGFSFMYFKKEENKDG